MTGPAPPLRIERVRAALGPAFPWDLHYSAVTGSTSDDARAAAAPHGAAYLADHQTAGRGARGRTWQSPPGGSLLLSAVLQPTPPLPATALTALGVLALVHGLRGATGLTPLIKWPNDAVIRDREVGGILVEVFGDTAIVGIGANLNFPATAIINPDSPATTISDELDAPCDREAVTAAVLNALGRLYNRLTVDPGALRAEWRRRSALLDRQVIVDTETESVRGVVTGFSAGGHLQLRAEDGRNWEFLTGRVRLAGLKSG